MSMHFSLSLSSEASSFISIHVIDWPADIDWLERKGLIQRKREAVLEPGLICR